MPVSLRVNVKGTADVVRMLNRVSPKKNGRWVTEALIESAERVQTLAARKYIIGGGRFRGPRGPRGGKGKLTDAPVNPHRITSRSNFLRSRIAVDHARAPRSVEIGTDVIYGPVHELGSPKLGIRARPFLQPALEEASSAFEGIFIKEWKKAVVR